MTSFRADITELLQMTPADLEEFVQNLHKQYKAAEPDVREAFSDGVMAAAAMVGHYAMGAKDDVLLVGLPQLVGLLGVPRYRCGLADVVPDIPRFLGRNLDA